MLFRTYARFLSIALSVCLITTTTPAVASSPDLNILDEEELSDHLDLAEKHLSDVEKDKASKMDIKIFEKNLDRTLEQMHKRTERKIHRASEKKLEEEYRRMKELYLNSADAPTKARILEIDDKDISTKEKLILLNGEENKLAIKGHIMTQVKEAGSVRAFVKEIRASLKEQRRIYKENKRLEKEGSQASLKIKTNSASKEAKRLPAQDGAQAGGISLGSLLLITGIILVVLGPAVVGATWVTVGWVFIAVFGIVPLAILLIIGIIALVAIIVAAEVKIKAPEHKPFELLPPQLNT